MFTILMIFHVIVCIGLILVVLMQSAKGEGLAGGTAFGGGMSGAVFGGRGAATFLSKMTTILAVVFMLNCGALAFMSADRTAFTPTSGTGDGTATESVVGRKSLEQQQQQATQQQQAAEQAARDSIEAISGGALNQLAPSPAGDTTK